MRTTAPMHGTPAERYNARREALSRVEAIMSRSWSQRDVQGEGAPYSPTLFGAQAEGAEAGGIEQRLAREG